LVVKERIMGSLACYFEEQGITKGQAEGKREAALSMLSKGLDIKLVSRVTKINIAEIKHLQEFK
jgi:hypothetical protein